jgi:uncharacterized protein YndB with AHSA1/START domain
MGDTLTKWVAVRCAPAQAYALFTSGIGRWWPLKSHSVFEDDATQCVLEARAGGRVYECSRLGGEALWGTVLLCEPGRRLSFSWHPGRPPNTAQEVSLIFHASEGGTRVELNHSGWEFLGARAAETRRHYETGWDDVLGSCYAACANHAP